MAQEYPADEARPRRRGRKLLVGLVVLLVLVAVLLVIADRVAVGVAERAIADRVSQEVTKQGAQSAEPDVEVGGTPFLTQVLDGRYQRISIKLRDVQASVEGDAVRLPVLDVDARNVRASLDTLRTGQGDVVADTVDGTGTISYDSLAALLDRPGLTLGEQGGKLTVTAPVDILGQKLTVSGTADVTVAESGAVALRFNDLDAAGLPNLPLARTLLNNYAKGISVDVPLPDLPFQLAVREVRPLPEGLAVTADAKNVPINSAG
ncbi:MULTISPECIES: LmeA family phospholipid-binding protein [unclassified Micromonospora]|uniref:LmeA family phospholipid-binding protein n=1 Tax=unclassified Micromonospora TaxID=2617518 RepID=UPI0033B99452